MITKKVETKRKKRSKKQKPIVLKALPVEQNGSIFYMVSVPTTLLHLFKLDIHDPESGKGYNRDLEERPLDFFKFLKEGYFSPPAIIANDRDFVIKVHPTKDASVVNIIISPSTNLYVLEGQGRIEGFKMFSDDDRFCYIPIHITRMSKEEEINHCRIINQKMKKMKSNLTLAQTKEVIYSFFDKKDGYTQKEKLQNVDSAMLVDSLMYDIIMSLNKEKNAPFYHRFILPNQKGQKSVMRKKKMAKRTKNDKTICDRTVNIGSHTHSGALKMVVENYVKNNLSQYNNYNSLYNDLYKIVKNFWVALKRINPVIFSDTKTVYDKIKNETKWDITIQGYHTQLREGCQVLYPLLKICIGREARTINDFVKIFSKSNLLKKSSYWEQNKNKTSGLEIAKSNTWSIERRKFEKEIFLDEK